MAKDYYSILGVDRSASDADIKQAYRKLSRELHPDKHKGDKAKEDQFKAVNEAYEVLSDSKKRTQYDQFGSADFNGGSGFGGFGGFQGFDASHFEGMGGFGDIFESFFSGGGGRQKRDMKGKSVRIALTITFMEAVRGIEKEMTIRMKRKCTDCMGNGVADGSKMVECSECHGTGTITKMQQSLFGMIQQSIVCSNCHGSGKKPEKPCPTCKGEGRKIGEHTITIRVPKGIDSGQTLRLTGEGEAGMHGELSGDLLVEITVTPDSHFRREDEHIHTTEHVSIADAVLGVDRTVATVHGDEKIHIPAGTQSMQILRLKGKGMPIVNTHRFGDQFITIIIDIPQKLTKEQRKIFEDLRHSS